MVALAHTLPLDYTKNRPIRHMTASIKATLHPLEFIWIAGQWANFSGGPEDYEYSVIMERTTPITNTRVWICDRDGEDGIVLLMMPSDY